MYLECESKAERARAFTVAKSMVTLLTQLDRGAALALEHLVDKWVTRGDIAPPTIQVH